jgi:hypothetical protein
LEASQQFSFYRVRLLAPRPTPLWRTRPLYLYPPEAGWPSYTPRHRVPILVASYDTHGLRWNYSYSPVTTRGVSIFWRSFSWYSALTITSKIRVCCNVVFSCFRFW